MSLRVLVTGGAGFIGSHLVERLIVESHQVDVVDDLSGGSLANLSDARSESARQLTFHQLDIRSAALGNLLARVRPQVVYHLAAASVAEDDPVKLADTIIVGSLHVLEAARAAGVEKVVFVAGADFHGEVAGGDLPVKESATPSVLHPRGVAEKAVFGYLHSYRELHNLEFSALVLGSVYGPRQTDRGLVGMLARRILEGAPCPIPGSGSQTRDFVYVDDVVDALARAAKRGGGLVLNVGTGKETTIADLHQLMAGHAGVESLAESVPVGAHTLRRSALDPGRAGIHLGWKSWTSLDDGIVATLAWYRGGE